MAFANTVKFTAGSTGASDFSDGTAATSCRNLSGGAVNGGTYSYRAVSADGSQWENGQGVVASGSPWTLARTTIFESSTGSKVSFTAAPTVFLTPLKADLDALATYVGASVASTAGTAIDFTGIPSWATEVKISLSGVSGSGTSFLLVQIGDSGGVEASGYAGGGGYIQGTANQNTAGSTAGLVFITFQSNINLNGSVVFTLMDASTNTWSATGILFHTTDAQIFFSATVKSLSAVLDRVRITWANGTDTFDAGKVNIAYKR